MTRDDKPPIGGNCLLAALEPQDLDLIAPHLEEVPLQPRQVVMEAGRPVRRAYFPIDCFVSLVITFENGSSVETATVGPEGVVGLPLFVNHEYAPTRAIVQSAGRALTIAGSPLRQAMEESATFRTLFSCYTHAFLTQVLQTVACNAMHSAEQRTAKWLLMSDDRVSGNALALTHEQLAEMLGVGRPTVSLAARSLQLAGLINYQRGSISVVDRPGLTRVSCPCYGMIREAYERLLPLTYKK